MTARCLPSGDNWGSESAGSEPNASTGGSVRSCPDAATLRQAAPSTDVQMIAIFIVREPQHECAGYDARREWLNTPAKTRVGHSRCGVDIEMVRPALEGA